MVINSSAVLSLICCANVTHAPNESSLSCNPDFPRCRYFILNGQGVAIFLQPAEIYEARGQIAGSVEPPFSVAADKVASNAEVANTIRINRAVVQLGRTLEWGSRGRGFKSRRPEVFASVAALLSPLNEFW